MSMHYDSTQTRDCWPAKARDWLTAHCAVRFGRLDRYDRVRRVRLGLVRRLARKGCTIRFATAHGFDIFLPGQYTAFITMILRGVLFHPLLANLLAQIIRPGDVFVDGGSNLGLYSLLAARLMRGQGRVFAFEPDPSTFALLSQNIALNGFGPIIQAEHLALANANQVFDFWAATQEPMLSSLIPTCLADDKKIQVTAVRLDDYLARVGERRVDVIKLDLEGGEPLAFDGMSSTLRAARALVFEVNLSQLAKLGVDPLQMVEDTAERGFFRDVMFITEEERKIYPWSRAAFAPVLRRDTFVNVVCAKASVLPKSIAP